MNRGIGLLDFCRVIAVIPALLVVHVLGLVFWVGGLLVTSMALTRHTQETSAEAKEALGRLERIYLRGLADPGALLTILAGLGLISTNSSYYLHAPWLHIKLTFVLFLIVRSINRLTAPKEIPPAAPPPTPEDVVLLREIRDLMKTRGG